MTITILGYQICPVPIRWTVFIVLSLCMFSYMYTYDTPVALQEPLQHEPWDLSNVEYNLLFSAYAWPNVIFPIIFGIFTDVIGVNKMLIALYTGMVIGNGIFVLGIHENNFAVMLIGRCFYGISAESFAMAETPLLYEYFFGKELSFALGFNLSFSRLGSAANDVLTYEFYHLKGVVFSMAMGAFVLMPICLLILSMLIAYRVFFEKKTKYKHSIYQVSLADDGDMDGRSALSEIDMTTKLISTTTTNEIGFGYDAIQETLDDEMDMSARMEISMASKYDFSMAVPELDHTLMDGSASMPVHVHTAAAHEDNGMNNKDDTGDSTDIGSIVTHNEYSNLGVNSVEANKFRFSDFKRFDTRYWLLVVNCCFQYGCVVPWMKIGGSYMQVKYEYSHHKANEYLMIPYIVSAVVTPVIGFGVDKLGRRCELLLIATVILTISHYILGWLTPDDVGIDPENKDLLPLAGLVGLGIGYSVFCAVIWPAFAVTIPSKLVGTGYGIPTSAYNLVLGLFFLLVGILTKDDEDLEDVSLEKYTDVEWFLLATCLCSIVTVFILWHADRTMGNLLGLPASKQIAILKMSIA